MSRLLSASLLISTRAATRLAINILTSSYVSTLHYILQCLPTELSNLPLSTCASLVYKIAFVPPPPSAHDLTGNAGRALSTFLSPDFTKYDLHYGSPFQIATSSYDFSLRTARIFMRRPVSSIAKLCAAHHIERVTLFRASAVPLGTHVDRFKYRHPH